MLETQNLPLPLDAGINSKQDPKLIEAEYAINVENTDYTLIGTAKKRNATVTLINNTTIGTAKQLHADEDNLVIMPGPGDLNYNNSLIYTDEWTKNVTLNTTIPVSTMEACADAAWLDYADTAHDTTNNVTIVAAYDNTNKRIVVDIIDQNTGARNLVKFSTTDFVKTMRTMYNSSTKKFFIFCTQTDNAANHYISCFYSDYNSLSDSAVSVSNIVTGLSANNRPAEYIQIGTNAYLAYFSAAATVEIRRVPLVLPLTIDLTDSFTVATNCGTISGSIITLLDFKTFDSGRWFFSYVNSSSNISCVLTDSSFTVLAQANFGTSGASASVSCVDSNLPSIANASDFLVLANDTNYSSSTQFSVIRRLRVDYSGNTITQPYVDYPIARIKPTSKIFGNGYFAGRYDSDGPQALQTDNYHYLLGLCSNSSDVTGMVIKVMSRYQELQAAPNIQNTTAALNNDGNYVYSVNNFNGIVQRSADNTTPYGIVLVTAEIVNNPKSNTNIRYGKSLIISGGYGAEFDGVNLVENGFHHRPVVLNSTTNAAAGNIAAGTYNYVIIYEYIDAYGQLTRSAPSFRRQQITTGANSTNTITAQTYQIGEKKVVNIVLYRTLAGGSVFYRCASIFNNSGVVAVNITDNVSDAVLANKEQLYTGGGVLENDPIKGFKYAVAIQNRALFAGGEDTNSVLFTKQFLFGESPNASYDFEIRTDGGMIGGSDPITALGAIDDKVIIFKRNYVFYVQGTYPNELGQQYGLSQPVLISAEVGCINNKTAVNVPDGIIFQSSKGWWKVTNAMAIEFVGIGAEGFIEDTITSGVSVFDKNQVRYTQESGKSLVYDYLVNKWLTFTNQNAIAADLWNGKYVLLRPKASAFLVSYESDTYKDNDESTSLSEYYGVKIETSWIKMTGIQNFGRVRRVMILGKYYSPHTLTVRAYYDYDDSTYEEYVYTHDENNGIYQFKVHLKQQKCQAVKLVIFDTPTIGSGQSMELTNLTLEIGIRKGLAKINTNKQV